MILQKGGKNPALCLSGPNVVEWEEIHHREDPFDESTHFR